MKKKDRALHNRSIVWLVGGGTAGHIMPLLAIIEALHSMPSITMIYLGEAGGREAGLAHRAGVRFIAIPSGKLRRYLTLQSLLLNIRDSWRMLMGIYKSYKLICDKHPDLIVSKGGSVALPVALAAYFTKTPVLTHESDAVLGFTNRLIARFATRVLTAFPASVYPPAYAGKITSVGLPIRNMFCQPSDHASRQPMVLITGGSQGAVAINRAVLAILPELLAKAQVMHITGELSYQECKAFKETLPPYLAERYGVIDFTPDIAGYMREATVVVSRASSTIFELAALHKPMILIPLPSAANNHQAKNAEIFVSYKAALLLNQDNLTPDRLYETITTVLEDSQLRRELKEGTAHFNSCESADRVAQIVKKSIGKTQ